AERETEFHGCLGAVIWVAICILCFVFLSKSDLPSQTHWLSWLSPFLVATCVTTGVSKLTKQILGERRANQLVEEKNSRLIAESIREAESLTRSLRDNYRQSLEWTPFLRQPVNP